MAITVRQLVATPHIGTRFLAGRAGGEQAINWAHSCEMPDPWDWLEPFDMLMTNGIGVPTDPDEQARYVERLADGGISAIAVGEDVSALELSPAMIAASERRALPILLTAYEVPFAAVARVVAEARTDGAERRRLMKTARIYESLRTATIEGRDAVTLLEDIGTELGCRLEVLDVATWRHSFAPAHCLPRPARTVLDETLERCAGHLPAILRLDLGGHTALAVPVPSRRPAALLASRFTDPVPELSVLQHVSTVAALELEKLAAERDSLNRVGVELLRGLLTGRPDAVAVRSELRRAGLVGPLVVATWSQRPDNDGLLHQELYARAVSHLLRDGNEDRLSLALIADDARSRRLLVEAMGADRAIGLSATFTTPDAVPHAARAARWAWHGATEEPGIVRYGADEPAAWGFALEQSEELVDHVLGRLLEYDRDHRTELVRTLAALLRNNRSPSPTAAELFIHRQTLVYRVRRIEQLTARHLARTKDVVDLWLAMRALEVIEGTSLLDA